MNVRCYLQIEPRRNHAGNVVAAKVTKMFLNEPPQTTDLVIRVNLDIDPDVFKVYETPVLEVKKDSSPPPVKKAEVRKVPRKP